MTRRLVACLASALLVMAPAASAAAAPDPLATVTSERLVAAARAQTNQLLSHFRGGTQSASPAQCGADQPAGGVDGVFLLPTLSFSPGSRTFSCTTTAHSVLVDLSGFTITEDDRFPASSYVTSNGFTVPFVRANLVPICDDLIAQGVFASSAPATLDGMPLTSPSPIDSGLFTATVNRSAQVPGDPVTDLYADSVALGHPGRLATVFCGFKALVRLAVGTHTIVVDYSGSFPPPTRTTFTFHITVTG